MTDDFKELCDYLEKEAARIGERFDSVIIIATVGKAEDASKVRKLVKSSGNFYTNYGAVRSWVNCMDEQDKVWTRQDMEAEEDL